MIPISLHVFVGAAILQTESIIIPYALFFDLSCTNSLEAISLPAFLLVLIFQPMRTQLVHTCRCIRHLPCFKIGLRGIVDDTFASQRFAPIFHHSIVLAWDHGHRMHARDLSDFSEIYLLLLADNFTQECHEV
jgi:hypothetical protein